MDRQERRYRTRRHVLRQSRIADQWDLVEDLHPAFYAHNKPWDGVAQRVNNAVILGRCKKKKVLDCGHTRCWMCGYGKFEGRNGRKLTRQEQSFMLDNSRFE